MACSGGGKRGSAAVGESGGDAVISPVTLYAVAVLMLVMAVAVKRGVV